MKFFLIISFVAGLCYGLEPAHHYSYKYSGSFKSGIPEDGNQVAGFGMKAKIDVFVENSDGFAIFKLSDIATLTFNEDLGITEEIDYTDKRFHTFEDEDLKGIFEQPFRVNLRGSEPFALEFEDTDHRWISNVRKGIASMFKNEILKGNFETQVEDSFSSFFHQGHVVNNFKVEEETLFGICETTYKIYKMPEGLFSEGKDLMPTVGESDQKDLWHVSRSIDFDKCKEIVAMHVHTTNNRRHKDKKLRFTRTSDSSYVLKGSPGHFDLYSVITQGTTTFPLSKFSEENAQSVVNQRLVLIDHDTTEVSPELGPSLKQSKTWMHEVWTSAQMPKGFNPHPWVTYSENNEPVFGYETFGTKKLSDDQIAAIKINILKYIKDASQRLTDLHQESEDVPGETPSDLLEMATVYFRRFLKKEQILKIFDHIFEEKIGIERELVINAAAASGFQEAFEAIMDYIEQDKLQTFQIFTTFSTMTRNSLGSLNISRIMDYLLRQEKPSEHLLNFAHYLSEYCIHKVHSYIPILGDSECDATLTTTRLIPYLKGIIYNESLIWERGYAIKALELMKTGFNYEILSPLIDGRVKISPALKAMAVRAFAFWDIYPAKNDWNPIISDLLTDVYSDVSQDLQVRIAALLSRVSWKPGTKFWYNLALNTWTDPSNEFASYSSSLIKFYAEDHPEQSEGASYALKFAKPPSKNSNSNILAFSKEFFNRKAKLTMLSSHYKTGNSNHGDTFRHILTNFEDLTLLKNEAYQMYRERDTLYNETAFKADHPHIPHAQEFLDNFFNEIHLVHHPSLDRSFSKDFYQVLDDTFFELSEIEKALHKRYSPEESNLLSATSWASYFYVLDKSDFHPNELGLPLYTHSSLPITGSFTQKHLPPQSGIAHGTQYLAKLSSVYSIGISVFLPWNHQFSTAMVRKNLEITLPVERKFNRLLGTEGPLRASRTTWSTQYKKKFPLIRVSNTPMTVTYDADPRSDNIVINFEVIKKVNINEKSSSFINTAGVKLDLVLKADTPTSFGLFSFFKFPDISFKAWSLDLYMVPEESLSKELLITELEGKLSNPAEHEDSGSDIDSEEGEKSVYGVEFSDTFEKRSLKIRNLLRAPSHVNEIHYKQWKFDLLGEDHHKQFEIFQAFGDVELEHEENSEKYFLQIIGFGDANSGDGESKTLLFKTRTHQYFGPGNRYYDSASRFHVKHVKETELEILLHSHNYSKPLLKTQLVFNPSKENYAKTEKYCNENYGEENCYVPKSEGDDPLTHDNIQVTFYERDHDATRDVMSFIQSLLEIPSVKGFGYEIESPDPQFNIRRNTHSGDWDLYLKYPSEDVFLSTFSDNIIIKYIADFPVRSLMDFIFDHRPFSYPKCTLTTNSVETFDGLKFNYELSDCWTLALQIPYSSPIIVQNVLLIKKSQGGNSIPDFKYIMFMRDTVIKFSNNEIMVNGTTVHKVNMDDKDSNYSLTIEKDLIYKRGNTYLIYLINTFQRPFIIISSNKIELYKEERHIDSNGICGNADGDTISELIGPKHCVYNDPQLFTASWTGQSENCDSATLEEFRKGVEDYQAKCKPYDDKAEGSKINPRCLLFGWKALSINESYCISAAPISFCSTSCDINKFKTVKMAYKCWPKEKAPESLRTSVENEGGIATDTVSESPFFYQSFYTEVAKICKQF